MVDNQRRPSGQHSYEAVQCGFGPQCDHPYNRSNQPKISILSQEFNSSECLEGRLNDTHAPSTAARSSRVKGKAQQTDPCRMRRALGRLPEMTNTLQANIGAPAEKRRADHAPPKEGKGGVF
ncbi:uncharacterized protein [Dermacentor albipictus]|uniref:uncharacterized protein isoform X2 n=1 Tax=Dermacentor albipictus TaxID=60249 RepID=UPI0038FCFE41